MENILISSAMNIILILISYYLFKSVISGPTRHKIYERFLGSFAKFIIFIFLASVIITGITALIFYKTRFIGSLNIIAPAIVSIFVGFIISTVPTKGLEDKNK